MVKRMKSAGSTLVALPQKEVENWFDFWALPTFGRLKCPRVHCLAGLNGSAELYRSNLRKAVEFLGPDVEAELSCSKIAVG